MKSIMLDIMKTTEIAINLFIKSTILLGSLVNIEISTLFTW